MQREEGYYIDGFDPPSLSERPVNAGAGAGAGAGALLVPGSMDWTDSPRLLAVSLTCATTRLMTLFFGAGFFGAARLTAFFGAGRAAAALRAAGFFAAFFAPPFLAADLAGAFFEAFFEAFFGAAFFAGRAFLLADFFAGFLDKPFFAALFFAALREELFLDAAMLSLLLKCRCRGRLDQGITLRGNLVARTQFRRTCLDCHAR